MNNSTKQYIYSKLFKKDVYSKEWCDAGGQILGYGSPEKINDIVPCEVCGKLVRIMPHFGKRELPSYPRHKKITNK